MNPSWAFTFRPEGGGQQIRDQFLLSGLPPPHHATAMPALIAIVGRPNVGKSALFNRLAGRRIAIVHDQPGVTRDRISAEAEWHGRPFTLVDTGGIGLLRGEKTNDPIVAAAFEQVRLAIESADLIFLVVDTSEGVVSLDREVASRLRQSGKTVLVAANKADNVRSSENATEFSELGFDRIFPVSAIHGRGLDALMQSAMSLLPSHLPPPNPDAATPAAAAPLKLAIVGRPNVGKSSLINAITHSSRVIVSPIPGTTRDSVDVPFEVDTEGHRQSYVLIDTAGIRKSKRVRDSVEFYSVQRAESSITRCDIALLVLDAESGILEQDKKIADQITSQNKACILVVNKWDLFQSVVQAARKDQPRRFSRRQDHQTDPNLDSFGRWVQESLFFLDYAPVIFTSATDGLNLDRLLESVRYVAAQLQQRIPTALLNRTIQQSVERRQPISPAGHFLNFFYATQTHSAPPTFLLFVNRDELFSVAYKKYLTGELRKAFGYEGCPIVLIPKARPKTIESVRTNSTRPRSSPRKKPHKAEARPRRGRG